MGARMKRRIGLKRRHFLVGSVAAGAGLVVVLGYRHAERRGSATFAKVGGVDGAFRPSAFVGIDTNGLVTLIAKQSEIGQGVKTALPMILAEELEVDWNTVVVEQADHDAAYGVQFTGGSSSVRNNFKDMRRLGATARTMLVTAAARAWGVPERECAAARGVVRHAASGRQLGYGALATAAASLPIPHPWFVRLKDPQDFKLLGTRQGGVDVPAIVAGAPLYGMDFRLPDMLYAVYERCPILGGRLRHANLDEIRRQPGVSNVFALEGAECPPGMLSGVAIVASSVWAAFSARRKLILEWQEVDAPVGDSDALLALAAERAHQPPSDTLRNDGDAAAEFALAAKRLEAEYAYPFIAHASMETLNCIAHVRDGGIEIWTASQSPDWARTELGKAFGVDEGRITLHLLRGGGSFGRRLSTDFVVEAAAIARRVAGPVQLVWSREDDLHHDHYRPAGVHHVRAGLDARGSLVAWHDHGVTFGKGRPAGGSRLSGNEFPAPFVKHCLIQQSVVDCGISMGMWRAPGDNAHAWVIESFIDELAHAAGRDPLAFRLDLLDKFSLRTLLDRSVPLAGLDAPRMRAVLQAAAKHSGWGAPMPRGRARGLACHFSYGGYVAQVVEVAVSKDGKLQIPKVVCVCDVGDTIVNLSGAEAQVQGSVIDGISAAWLQELHIRNGRVAQSNFDKYRLLRMADAPAEIEVHFLKSAHSPSGLGEPALPPVAPALCNAIFSATGVRVRRLPIARHDLSWS